MTWLLAMPAPLGLVVFVAWMALRVLLGWLS
jgi:hypothetical protein